jgi:hypothetical protein
MMEYYQERAIGKRRDLKERIERLEKFVRGETFNQLPNEEADLLVDQLDGMRIYFVALDARIKLWRIEHAS